VAPTLVANGDSDPKLDAFAALRSSQTTVVVLEPLTRPSTHTAQDPRAREPVIDRAYPLAQAVAAIRHLELGHARGKMVVAI
jgi:hypothetical protein